MRISGLSSGLDTEQLVKDIMTAERIPVDRVFQQKVQAEWKRDAYREINTKLLRFRNMSFDLGLQGTFQKTVATSSNSDLVSVQATGAAQAGSFDLKVNSLAEAARFHSADGVKDRFEQFQMAEGGASFMLRGVDGEGVEIKVSEGESLESVLAKINSTKDLGITAFYDSFTDKVSFSTRVTGEDAKIELISDDASGFFTQVFLPEDGLGEGVLASGKNAKIILNGLETERESNSFEFNGTKINLLGANEDTTIRIDVEQDIDAIVDQIKDFVNLYNELVDELNATIREGTPSDKGRYEKFLPLTPQQREAMSEQEIELWEEKAKTGLLRSDRLVGNILTEMRMALGGVVEGLEGNNTLAQIGIKTGSWYEYGRLNIDEEKLRSAVENDAAGVRNIFTNNSEVGVQQGLAKRLTKVLDAGMSQISETAGKASISYDQSYLGEQIRGFEDRLAAMEERLLRVEQMHWDKFTAMERVLGQLYAQSDWLSQQLMSMMGS